MAIRAEEMREEVDLDRDRALVLRYQQGDEAAFEELYSRYFPRLHLYCRRRVADSFAAEELAQEAFVRALRALPRFAGERRFYPWMTVIAQRLCIDHHRSTSRVEPAADIDTGVVDADPGDVFTAVDRQHLTVALDRVTDRHREVLRLREQEQWSYQQIAEHLDVPMTTVEALLHRARKSLRREFLAAGGRLSSLPVIGGLAAGLGRLRARIGSSAESTAQSAAGYAMAGIAAAGLIAVPFMADGGAASPAQATSTAVPAAAPASAAALEAPAPGDPVLVAAAAPTPAAAAPATEAPAGTDVGGLATVYTTPEGADHAGDQAEAMPLHLIVSQGVRAGADPARFLNDLLAAAGGQP